MNTATHLHALSLLIVFANLASAADLVERLPSTTRLLLRVPNGQQWVEDFDATAIHAVIHSDAFKPIRDHLGLANDGQRALQQAGLRAKDIRRLAEGEVILARVDRPASDLTGTDSSPKFAPNDWRATVTAFEVEASTANEVMTDLRHALTIAGAVEEKISPENAFPVRFRWPDQSEAWIYDYSDGHFFVCDREWISERFREAKSTTNSTSSKTDTLQSDASFIRVMQQTAMKWEATSSPTDLNIEIQWFAKPWALVSPSETTNMLIAQGFGDVKAMGGRLWLSQTGTTHCSMVVADGPLQKAAGGLAFHSREVPDIPTWILKQATGCWTTQLDFAQALKGYGHWFDAKHGGGDEGLFDIVLDDIRDEPGSPGIDIRTDLVGQFDGPLLSLVVPVASSESGMQVFAIRVKNTDTVTKAIRGLLNGDPDVQQLNIDAFPCWKFGDLSRGGTRQVLGPDLSGLTICVAREYVIAAPQEVVVRTLLDPNNLDTNTDTDSEHSLEAVAEELDVDRPIGLGFSNSLGPIGKLYERVAGLTAREQAKSMTIPELLRIFHINASDAKVDEFRSKLPRESELVKLFGRSIDAAEQVDGGWLLKGVVMGKAK